MDVRRKPVGSSNSTDVFKGSALVSALLYTSPRRFKCRASAFKFARRLFKLGFIRSIFGWTTFEDSSHLYRWEDENVPPRGSSLSAMMSYSYYPPLQKASLDGHRTSDKLDNKLLDDVKGRLLRDNTSSGYLIDSFFRDLEKNFPEECRKPSQKLQSNYWQNKRASTTSTDSSADPYSLYKSRDRLYPKSTHSASMASSRDHSVIPEEAPDTYMIGRLGMQMPPFDYEISSNTPGTYNSHASSGAESGMGGDSSSRRFADQNFSFSDNEKQLLEEMKRMKKEHQHILRSYEDRINKLMMKMHELRSIAEMLENSSTKSSPYGIIPGKGGLLGSIDAKLDQDRPWTGSTQPQDSDVPPPLPPRPSRGNKVYPNKPILQPRRKMKYIAWKRIILSDLGTPGSQLSIWHTMIEPRIDTEAVELVFNDESDGYRSQVSLYDDVVARRGRSRSYVSVVDRDKAQIFVSKMHFLKLTLQDVIQAISELQTPFLDEEGADALLDLILSHKDMDRVLHQAQRKGTGQFDIPDYIMYEVSRIDHYREKAELLRFQQRIHDYLFDIDQQLKDVRTACEEICSSVFLKNLLETLLAVGNHMNGGTASGQADGYHLEVLATLKEIEDREGRENLLVFLIKTYCQQYTQDVSRYSLPEPSNMRHAAQVSLNDVNNALCGLSDDLAHVRKSISPLLYDNNGTLPENISNRLQQFFAKAEEGIEAQMRHFRETKDNFQRTAAYFMFDGEQEEVRQCTKTFFGTWATFLHDCKHHWKDVQRKLAKERFQTNFTITRDKKVPSRKLPLPDPPPEIPPKPSPMVSTSSSKLNQSPTKSSGESLPTDTQVRGRNLWETSESSSRRPRDPHHSKHNAERQTRADQEHCKPLFNRKQTYHKDGSSTRSPSPKRIISTPPTTGDIHRPVPTPPKPSKPYSNNLQVHPSNYENQDDALLQHPQSTVSQKDNSPTRYGGSENMPPSPRRAQIPVPDPEESQRKQSTGFSLKSWLRKENVKSRQPNQEQMVSPKEPEHQNKSNTAFVKLRNTVVQKFGNNGGSRRGYDASSPESKHRSAVDHREFRHHSLNKYSGNRDSSSGRSRSRSPSGDRNPTKRSGHQDSDMEAEEEVAFYNGRGSKPRDKPPNKNVPPVVPAKPQAEVKANFASFGIIDPNTGSYRPAEKAKQQSDVNNNEQGSPRVVHSKRVRGRDRAPLALGSNMSLSDPYPRPDGSTNLVPQRQSWDANPQSTVPSNSARAQRQFNTIAGSSPVNPIPTYRAKVIHMYENQSKYDASEMVPPGVYHEAPQDLHSARGPHRYNTMGPNRASNYLLMQSKEDQHGNAHQDRSEDRFADQRRQQQGDLKRMPQDKGIEPMGMSYQGNNQGQQTQLNPRDKAAAHAQSITSLIERFEAGKGPPPPGYQGSTVAMTSTPVTQRKNLQISVQPESAGRDGQRQMYDHIQNPFPLLDGVTQAASTGSGKSHGENQRGSNPGGDSRHHGDSNSRASHHQYHGNSSGHPGPGYDQQRRPEQDEGYRDQLRRALNNNSNVVMQRYSKPSPGYSGHSSTSHRSPPQMMRAMPVKPSVYHHGGVTV
ncbi:uncharacterized protein LOC135475149 isoform X2 [Liolophura sinensis]|uniref:uncharacterized protein LOC135475149 isoform X2 n=1 Tax=Liolophura sinensis TaxID=3198878 RepID=UPI0031580E97